MRSFMTDDLQEQAIKDLQLMVACPSYCDEEHAEEGAPFGPGIAKCLDTTLDIFEKNGFSTYKDPKGYYGYAEIGEGTETLAVLCHLDVVPAGDLADWNTDPFKATLIDGNLALVGRGVQDDKGPTMMALYALKAVTEGTGLVPNKKIRFIFGTDEETLWRCMDHYNAEQPQADMGFAPDADFPLIYAEKGLLQAEMVGPKVTDYTVTGGSALNVVPNKAQYVGPKAKEVAQALEKLGYDYKQVDDSTIEVYGKAVHSKDAPEGINAITRLAEALATIYDDPMIQLLGKTVKADANGVTLVGDVEDEVSGKLTFNIATIQCDANGSKVGIDLRIPVTVDKDELVRRLSEKLEANGLEYSEVDYVASLYVPQDSTLVKNLLEVYRDYTGDMEEPLVSGGATFARTMNNCVAFGPFFPYSDNTEHQANETLDLKEMRQAMDIYAEAFYRLAFEE